jgi:hypothetical protein
MNVYDQLATKARNMTAIPLLFALLSLSGCFLDAQGTRQCDDGNSFVVGCFVHPDGESSGIVIVEHVDACLLSGTGYGITELGLPADSVWSFQGEGAVVDGEEGVLHLAHVTVAHFDEDTELQIKMDMFHRAAEDGTETLVLRDGDSLAQVTLNSVPCRP